MRAADARRIKEDGQRGGSLGHLDVRVAYRWRASGARGACGTSGPHGASGESSARLPK